MCVGHPDGAVVGGKLAQLLAAAAAGRDGLVGHRAHGHCQHAPAACGHHHGQGRGFGAPALRVGGVLDIAAGVDAALFVQHRRAHGKVRVRRVGLGAHGLGCGHQVGHVGFDFTRLQVHFGLSVP
jgi:hypothetical protein